MLTVRQLDPHPLRRSSPSAVATTHQVERRPQARVREGSYDGK